MALGKQLDKVCLFPHTNDNPQVEHSLRDFLIVNYKLGWSVVNCFRSLVWPVDAGQLWKG